MEAESSAGTDRQCVICPKCGYHQEEPFECHRCGVIFHKYKARMTASAPHTGPPGSVTYLQRIALPQWASGKVILCIGLIAINMLILHRWYTHRPIVHGNGIIAPRIPQQVSIRKPLPFRHKDYVITPLATFDIEARVLAITKYRLDSVADLAPYDIVLGWQHMSDEAVLDHISITQSNRFYYWWTERLPIPYRAIVVNSANMHLIPADRAIAKQLGRLRPGHVVTITGFLVRADLNQWHWISSLTRQDTGAGGCELIWVQTLTVR